MIKYNILLFRDEIMTDLNDLAIKAEERLLPLFKEIDNTAFINQKRVMNAFKNAKLSESHFFATTGYGYNDRGRDVIDEIYAEIFGCEDALVRNNFVSGTHTLATALFGVLRPGDTIFSVTGKPYDTLDEIIGIVPSKGSLAEFGVSYRQVDFKAGKADLNAIKEVLQKEKTKVVFIQRSKGYFNRPTLSCKEIGEIVDAVKSVSPDTITIVDNCYGEFCETVEPTHYGADLIVGSLIKNAGGGMADSGGYIAGKRDLVELCAYRLTSPGIGKEVGPTFGQNRNILKGVFYAPHTVKESLKTAMFAASLFDLMGYSVNPSFSDIRNDIIQVIELKSKEKLLAFCRGIQYGSPIDSYVTPEPWDMPGYTDQVVMAAGTFTQGASIELSADAPIREPFNVFFQGGLTYESGKIGILSAAKEVLETE